MVDGVHVALITALDGTGQYLPAVEEAIVAQALPLVHGFSILGSTGEGPSLAWSVKEQVIRHVVAVVGGRAPISCGVAAGSVGQCIEACETLRALGVDAALVLPPYYYPLTGEEIAAFYRAVARQSPLPVVIYHIPQFTKAALPVEVIHELSRDPNIVAMKDSSMDYGYFQRVRRVTADVPFRLYTGSDDLLLASTRAGGNGAICASANVAPQLSADLWQGLVEGADADALWATQDRIVGLVDACRQLGAGRAWKAAVELMGLGMARPVAPLAVLSGERRARLAAALAAAGLLPGDGQL